MRHWNKKANFLVCKLTGFVNQTFADFVKMILARVSSHWLWLESSLSAKNVTRVESAQHRFLTSLDILCIKNSREFTLFPKHLGYLFGANGWHFILVARVRKVLAVVLHINFLIVVLS